MPMRRRATRNSRPPSRTMSWPRKWISPAVGSTRRLMDRTSVDLPVPDGPMIAVMPRPSTVSETSLSTGCPGRYSLRKLRMTSARSTSSATGLSGVDTSMARMLRRLLLLRRRLLLLLLCQRLGLALCFRLERCLVVGRAGPFGDLAHHFPGVLVGDREEAVVAVELLAHRGREVEGKEAGADFLGQIRMEVVCVGEGRGREKRAREDDAEVIRLQRSARDHPLEHVGSDTGHVVVARRDAEGRLVVSARHQRLVVLVGLEALRRVKHERREVA